MRASLPWSANIISYARSCARTNLVLYRLSGYLKDDSLVALLDGRMNATVDQKNEGGNKEKMLKTK